VEPVTVRRIVKAGVRPVESSLVMTTVVNLNEYRYAGNGVSGKKAAKLQR
jgi:hypothetical protein